MSIKECRTIPQCHFRGEAERYFGHSTCHKYPSMPETAVRSIHTLTPQPKVSTGVDKFQAFAAPALMAVVFLALSVRFFLLVHKYAVNLFFFDQWQIEDALLFQKHSLLQIFFWQHGLHRQGIGNLLLAIFEPLVRWNGRADAFLVAALLTVACGLALWLKVRLFGKMEYSDVAIPLLFFTPVQWGTFLGALNPSYAPIPTLLVVMYCLGWTVQNRSRRYPLVLFLNFLLIYTGYGVLMGLLTPLFFGLEYLRYRDSFSAGSVLVSIVCLASFFLGYRLYHTADGLAPQGAPPMAYLAFIVLLFSTFLQIPFGWIIPALFVGAGLIFATASAAASSMVRAIKERSEPGMITFVLLSFSLLFCAATSLGRTAFGAPASRYMTYMILAGLGLYLASLAIANRTPKLLCVWGLVLGAGWGCLRIIPQERNRMEQASQSRRLWRDCYLSVRDIQTCDSRSGGPIAWPPEPKSLKQKLDYLERQKLNLFSE